MTKKVFVAIIAINFLAFKPFNCKSFNYNRKNYVLTNELAQGYFDLKQKLRIKANKFLTKLLKLEHSYQISFELYNRYYQGLEYYQDFRTLYNALNWEFEKAFEEIDYTLIFKGRSLDTLDAPKSIKIKFINDLNKKLKTLINNIINKGNKQINLIKKIDS